MAKKKSKHSRLINTKETIASWVRNTSGEIVLVQLDQVGGRDVINIRVWHRALNGKLIPTQYGITLVLEQLPKLAWATLKAYIVASKRGLIHEAPISRSVTK